MAEATVPAVLVEGLVKHYGKVEALRGVDLTVAPGELFALLGPNGAGKTTLFSILSTLRAPTAGTAKVLGHDVVAERDTVRRSIGIVFQEPAIEQSLTVRDNLRLMGSLYGLKAAEVRARAEQLLVDLQLTEAAGRPARTLSGGQRRRVELARALVTDPRVLFLDEATLGLDVDARRGFWKHVRAMANKGRAVVFATHYMEEAEVADRIALIAQGKIVALDTPQALKARMGGGIIRLSTADDAQARAWLTSRGYAPTGGREIRLEQNDPAAVVPMLLREMPVRVERVEVHAPSLEDVFLQLTGRGLGEESPATDTEGGAP
jgi:ABC-2 type transport system ATP-binding protein